MCERDGEAGAAGIAPEADPDARAKLEHELVERSRAGGDRRGLGREAAMRVCGSIRPGLLESRQVREGGVEVDARVVGDRSAGRRRRRRAPSAHAARRIGRTVTTVPDSRCEARVSGSASRQRDGPGESY